MLQPAATAAVAILATTSSCWHLLASSSLSPCTRAPKSVVSFSAVKEPARCASTSPMSRSCATTRDRSAPKIAKAPEFARSSCLRLSSAASPWRRSRTTVMGTTASRPSCVHLSVTVRPSVSSSSSSSVPQSTTFRTVASSHAPLHLPSTTAPSCSESLASSAPFPAAGASGGIVKIRVSVSSSMRLKPSRLCLLTTSLCAARRVQTASRTLGIALTWKTSELCISSRMAIVRLRSSAVPTTCAKLPRYSNEAPKSLAILLRTEPPLPMSLPLALPSRVSAVWAHPRPSHSSILLGFEARQPGAFNSMRPIKRSTSSIRPRGAP
mmetsp:Transcript_148769/g.414480  ORF Transcript_148769/g.414480 Transcript_148769/m.414480 type:complete len:324 (+) Transcript_148769:142-1113(+)